MKNNKLSILVVEDDIYISHSICKLLNDFGAVDQANLTEIAKNYILTNHYDLLILDLNLDKGNKDLEGLNLLELARKNNIYTIILSSNESLQTTKKVYELGANHFLRKSAYKESLAAYVETFIHFQFKQEWSKSFSERFITQDKNLLEHIRNLASFNMKDKSIFLKGETGVGKTYLAKILHELSNVQGHFIHFNCSEIPKDLIESELFGYSKGAFTGAQKTKVGLLELANNGTLFLDEIATMPIETQQKLLKAIDEKSFYPLGSNVPKKVNFTLVSATCEDLNQKIKEKKFREDFYYRLAGFEITIPPLRERTKDIELQIFNFMSKSERKFFIEEDVLETLKDYSWPGNSRELNKVMNILSQSQEGIIKTDNRVISSLGKGLTKTDHFLSDKQFNYIYNFGLKAFIKECEKSALKETLSKNKGKVTQSIQDLQISSSNFYRINNTLQK